MFAADRIEQTERQVAETNGQGNREGPAISRAPASRIASGSGKRRQPRPYWQRLLPHPNFSPSTTWSKPLWR